MQTPLNPKVHSNPQIVVFALQKDTQKPQARQAAGLVR
jgi:hypothetical protein